MRQGIFVTALLFIVAIPTVVLTDGWQSVSFHRLHWTGLHVSGLSTAFTSRASDRPAASGRVAARSAGSAPATAETQGVGNALAVAQVFARGAGAARAEMGIGDDETSGASPEPRGAAPKAGHPTPTRTPTADADKPALAQNAADLEASLKTAHIAATNARVDIDYGTAMKLYALADNPEDAEARYAMALDYLNATPAPDYASAAYWMLTAAERGHGRAEAALADMYAEGTGLPRNQSAAFLWYTLAERDLSAEDVRAAVADKLDRLDNTMSLQQRADADQLIRQRAVQTAALMPMPNNADPMTTGTSSTAAP